MPLESSVSDATIWSITVELSITLLEAPFVVSLTIVTYKRNFFTVQATGWLFRTFP